MSRSRPNVRVASLADLELEYLSEWWDENRPEARVRVGDAFEMTVDRICEDPEIGKLYPLANQPNVRVIPMHKSMPYMLYYSYDEDRNEILVRLAWSSARGEKPPI